MSNLREIGALPGASSVRLAGILLTGVPLLAGALEIDVPSGTTNLYTSTIGSGESTLVKTGDGRLHLKLGTTQSGFTGAISVNGGTLGLDSPKNLGTPSSITVANGATLDPEKLDHEVKPRVCILQANGGIDGAKPTLVNAEAPWNVSVSGNKVYVYYPTIRSARRSSSVDVVGFQLKGKCP